MIANHNALTPDASAKIFNSALPRGSSSPKMVGVESSDLLCQGSPSDLSLDMVVGKCHHTV